MAENRGRQAAVTQTQETAEAPRGQHDFPPQQGPQMGLPMAPPVQTPHLQQQEEYSGIGNALKRQAQVIHEPLTIMADLSLQRDVQDSAMKQTAFREFATNYNQMRIYIAMVGEQKTITMIHTIGAYYSIRSATNAYQGKIMGFIGDRRATKEPTPICLPQVKAWQWYTGQVNADKEDFMTFYEEEANRNKWWIPTSEMTQETKAPYLLAIPNAMVAILREAGGAATPPDILNAVDEIQQATEGAIAEEQWKTVIDWCILAGQASQNGKSLLSIEVASVVIDDDEFDTWVGSKLDVALGPRPAQNTQQGTAQHQPQILDYLQMSRLLASTVGQGMMNFTQAVAAQTNTSGTPGSGQGTTLLEANKGFDRDQIAKLKDACGVVLAREIPNIWYVIQSTKGKAYDTYRDHLKKTIEAYGRTRHIEWDKSIYLKNPFFDDLIKLRFNPGGPVAQYDSAHKGISLLACRSLTAVEQEYQREYEEAYEQTRATRKVEDVLKEKDKKVAPAPDYMQLKLNVGTFCALLFALFGEKCDYYRELVKIHNILDREECFTIRDAYTKEICARITWAIIDDGRSFFGRNPVASDFAQNAPPVQFSVSCLSAITDAVRNAQPVGKATFPPQWQTIPPPPEQQAGGRHTQRDQQHQMPTVPPPTGWTPPTQNQQQQGRRGQGNTARGAPPEDFWHPKIKNLMDTYLARYNNHISLSEILNAAGKTMKDLPTLPNYCTPTGTSYLCWNSVLGRCFRGKRCKYNRGHVRKGDVTDTFADGVSDVLGKGVLFFTEKPQGPPSPPGKRKATEGSEDA
jgi:hypothetical protein